ncbi:MAG: diacylglycerol kinase [Pseudomonadota bacterium]
MTDGAPRPPSKTARPIWAHPLAAFGFSMAGLRFLMTQRAAQLQVAMLVVAILAFVLVGAGAAQWAIMGALFLVGLGVEALNTAIELTVDRLSPEISDYAKHAKDLGSFAVFCALTVFGGHGLWVVGAALLVP